jgi:hypothetical protein
MELYCYIVTTLDIYYSEFSLVIVNEQNSLRKYFMIILLDNLLFKSNNYIYSIQHLIRTCFLETPIKKSKIVSEKFLWLWGHFVTFLLLFILKLSWTFF